MREEMYALVRRAQKYAKATRTDGHTDCHGVICTTLADEFKLWNKADQFPTWLSRVVEGVIRDVENGETSEV